MYVLIINELLLSVKLEIINNTQKRAGKYVFCALYGI